MSCPATPASSRFPIRSDLQCHTKAKKRDSSVCAVKTKGLIKCAVILYKFKKAGCRLMWLIFLNGHITQHTISGVSFGVLI